MSCCRFGSRNGSVGRILSLGLVFTFIFCFIAIPSSYDSDSTFSRGGGGDVAKTAALTERVQMLEAELESVTQKALAAAAASDNVRDAQSAAGRDADGGKGEAVAAGIPRKRGGKQGDLFKWGLITTMPCRDTLGATQRAAFASWEKLTPKPRVVVLSECLPAELKDKATLLKLFDETFDGQPLFSGMMFATLKFAAVESLAVVAWINADILLAQNVADSISASFHLHKVPWLLLGTRHNIPASELYDVRHTPEDLGLFIRSKGEPHTTGGVDLFVWNQPHKPIVRAPFPPFIRSANIWDNWWVTEAAATRLVVDGGMHMSMGHIEHQRFDDKGAAVVQKKASHKVAGIASEKQLLSPWTSSSFSDWHNYHNRAVLIGEKYQRGYTRGAGTPNVVAVQIVADPAVGLSFQIPPFDKPQIVGQRRVTLWKDKRMREFPTNPRLMKAKNKNFGMPHNLTTLLSTMDKSEPVLLTGATVGFIPFVMSWICNLRRLGEFRNVMIAAFDDAAYDSLYHLGMPVFIPSVSLGQLESGSTGRYAYGNEVYKQVTKMKTAVVLDVLQKGHDVIWCDPDIVVYKPFIQPLLKSEFDFQLQNNNPTSLKTTKKPLLMTNSGFYLARSKPWVIDALGAVVRHAAKSTKSEQMSWNAVLCKDQDYPKEQCYYKGNPLQFLPRQKYATGNEEDTIWKLVGKNTPPTDLVVWHNNWITGYDAKMKRLKAIKQLWWDEDWEHCSSDQERHFLDYFFRHKSPLPGITTSWGDWPPYIKKK